MRIGVDATCWQNTRGYGRYGRALLNTLVQTDPENEYVFIVDSPHNLETLPSKAKVEIIQSTKPTAIAAAADGSRSVGDMWRMSRAMSKPDYDLLLFPTVYSYVPVISRAKKIVMIMDTIVETFPQLTMPSYTTQLFWKTKVALGRWQANIIVTLSEYSQRGIVEHFNISPEQVAVLGAASDPVFRHLNNPKITPTLKAMNINSTDRFIAYVGGFGPHKNLEMLVTTFAKFINKDENSDIKLILVGEYKKEVFHSHFGKIKRQIEKLDIADNVVFTGYLPDDELVILLNLATVLVLPSLMEGFGLPAVEAAACGCPVIATTASPLPTLLGNGGIYIDPTNPKELAAALTRIVNSKTLQQQMRQAGLAASKKLTWEATAQRMVNLMQKVFD